MIEQAQHLKAPVVETEQATDSHVVYPGFIGAMIFIQAPGIVAFDGVGGVQLL